MAVGIATGFVRKLYRILDLESDAVISWDVAGASFSIHDAEALAADVLPRYFRGRLCAFRQQLVDHGFEQLECEDNETREAYRHEHFVRGRPAQLSLIARVPKPKRKQQQQQSANSVTVMIGKETVMPALLQVKQPAAPRSLTVTLNAGVKRTSQSQQQQNNSKRLRSANEQQQQTLLGSNNLNTSSRGSASGNPLFSNDADSSALSFARLAESGLLPHSSDLPEPISYLSKLTNGSRNGSSNGNGTTAAATSQTLARMVEPPMFSDDLFRSALFFLASTSTTGVEPTATNPPSTASSKSNSGSVDKNGNVTVPSNLLSMLLASSTSGMPAGTSFTGSGSWGSSSNNPLFSDQSAGDDDDDQDSIWNLLVASSVDRVKSAIGDLESPQERLKVILAERERLEEQRKKFSRGSSSNPEASSATSVQKQAPVATRKANAVSSNPLFTRAATAATTTLNPLFARTTKAPNPLFAKAATTTTVATSSSEASNPLFAKPTKPAPASSSSTNSGASDADVVLLGRAGGGAGPNEDDLWRLLMSSSIDSFRRIGEFEV